MLKSFTLYFIFQFSSLFLTSQNEQLLDFQGASLTKTEFEDFIAEQMTYLGMPGLSIVLIANGEVVFHSASGVKNKITEEAVDDNTIFEAASLSKPIFAYFSLKLAEKGVIDLDRPLFYYLQDSLLGKDPRYKRVTARMVLSHNTGFPNWRWFSSIPDSINVNRGEFYMLKDPGTGFSYSGEAYQYLARVLAHNTFSNMNEIASLFSKEVLQPLEMNHAYFVWDDHLYHNKAFGHQGDQIKREWGSGLPSHTSYIFNAAGGLHTEAKSYANFLIALINQEGLYPSSFKQMFTPYTNLPSEHKYVQKDSLTAWGLGLGIGQTEEVTIYRHGGSNSDFQSEFLICPERKFGYVFFTNCDKGNEFKAALEAFLKLK